MFLGTAIEMLDSKGRLASKSAFIMLPANPRESKSPDSHVNAPLFNMYIIYIYIFIYNKYLYMHTQYTNTYIQINKYK